MQELVNENAKTVNENARIVSENARTVNWDAIYGVRLLRSSK